MVFSGFQCLHDEKRPPQAKNLGTLFFARLRRTKFFQTNLLDAKIFPDKKCPVSGFCLNPLPTVLLPIGHCLVKFQDAICSTYVSRTLESGFFCTVVQLFENNILNYIYSFQGFFFCFIVIVLLHQITVWMSERVQACVNVSRIFLL